MEPHDLPFGYAARCARLAGISRQAVGARIKNGWPLHALHRATRPAGETRPALVRMNIVLWGLHKPTRAAAARAAGLQPSVFYNRIKLGWSKTLALSTPKQAPGRQPGSLRYRSEKAGLPYGTVAMRVYGYGWTMERALSTPIDPLRSAAAKAGRRRSRQA